MRYVALLRGVNLGPHKRVAMADLREVLAALGHADVATYLQSGNAVFTSPRKDPDKLAREVERGISRDLGLDVRVVIRTAEELAKVVDGNPFPEATKDPARLHVGFLTGKPNLTKLEQVDASAYEPDRYAVGDGVLYLWYPNGMQKTNLNDAFWRQIDLGVQTTLRNWNTVTKLLALAAG